MTAGAPTFVVLETKAINVSSDLNINNDSRLFIIVYIIIDWFVLGNEVKGLSFMNFR